MSKNLQSKKRLSSQMQQESLTNDPTSSRVLESKKSHNQQNLTFAKEPIRGDNREVIEVEELRQRKIKMGNTEEVLGERAEKRPKTTRIEGGDKGRASDPERISHSPH